MSVAWGFEITGLVAILLSLAAIRITAQAIPKYLLGKPGLDEDFRRQGRDEKTDALQRDLARVHYKSHLNGLIREGNERSVLKGLGGKEKTGIDVVLHQSGILCQDFLHGGAMGQESQDILRSEPGATDDGFAYHHFGIDGYPFQQIFIIHEDAIGCSFDINVSFDYRFFSSSRTSKTKSLYLGRIEKLSFSQ